MGSSSLASPAFVVGFSFFLLSHLVIHSSHATHPECGFGTIYCEYGKHIINSTGGKPYEVKSFNETDNTIVIHDFQLSESLYKGDCSPIDFSLPNFIPLSFEVKTPNLTMFKCKKSDDIPPEIPDLLDPGFGEYRHCEDNNVLVYGKLKQPPAQSPPPPAPHDCSVFQFPVQPPSDGNWSANLFVPFVEMGFSLKWRYPSECHDCETKCERDWDGALKNCAETKHGGKRLLASLGIGFGAFVGGILLPIIFFYCRRRRRNGRFFGSANSKNRSSSLTPLSGNTLDLEKGGSTYFRVPIFSYEELVDATNNFDSSKELGDGGFGIVYYGKLRDGREVAIKRLYENTFKRVEQFMNEVEILNRLRHQNLVTLYGCTSRHSRELLLVYEYIPNGTVADHLHGEIANAVSLRWPTRLSIAIETASALAYLHASDIIHRDVKTNNILLDNNFRVKVADFGLSRLFPLDVTHVSTTPQGTPGYVDPEYRRCYQLTEKSDVYSFGVVLIELISSLPAVDINRHRQEINLANLAMNKIQSGALHELIDPCLGFEADYGVRMMTTLVAELAFRCLQLDREMRPSMDEVLEVLKGIESEDYKMEKEEVVGIPAEEVGMLKSIQPPISQA